MSTQTALITNDDGILSPGLAALAGLADRSGLTTVVAAPASEASGTSAGLTAAEDRRQVAVRQRSLEGLDVPGYAVAGHPGLIALLAAQGAFGGRPDVVLSGVNRGANVGRAVLHSGTVGAALTAGINGIRALAVSLDVGMRAPEEHHWETAVEVAGTVLKLLWELPPGSVLNLNVPNVPVGRLGPLRRASLAEHGTVQSRVRHLDGGGLELVTVEVEGEIEAGSDVALLAQGCPTVTPLCSVAEDAGVVLPLD
ncbi:5'/3'-nucleotidase SurE [Crossiella sp. CA-258035]|uniref:5'/3'-nucleotidase SurE n=1 Tax=Crossiella sp. CA-258035 TaxID=2981138 RepID=UPI0024BCB759|nr:5'/3'-nucleotidase SurE [Crossiella sp. CA-258035]WHT15982.1 5'/3'-nucleotidase SurE [Crossiella sp. CA-258035]